MITTVTLNPCIDLTLRLDRLDVGGLNLAVQSRSDAGGKGVNVSVVLRALGLSTMCTGISFDGSGTRIYAYLEEQCIAHNFAVAHGEMRTNVKLTDASTNQMTEINSCGCPVEERVVREYLDKLFDLAHRSSIIVMSGRVPNGGYEDLYKRSMERIQRLDVLTVVDAEKEPLKQAVLAKPYLIKPNIYEMETAFGCKIHSKGDAVDACRDIVKKGVTLVCCSMGGDGAVLVGKKEAWYAPAPPIEVKGLQGAGDSLVAGLCKGIREGMGLDDMLCCGVAAASASLLREGTQLCRRADYDRILPQIKAEKLPMRRTSKR